MKTRTLISIIYILVMIVSGKQAFAYDDVETHPKLTEKAIEFSNLYGYLKYNMGFTAGSDQFIPTDSANTIKYLLRAGSTAEDHPLCRASTHFQTVWTIWGQT